MSDSLGIMIELRTILAALKRFHIRPRVSLIWTLQIEGKCTPRSAYGLRQRNPKFKLMAELHQTMKIS